MNWFYEKNGTQKGPLSTDALQALLQQQEITEKTLVWREGLSDWTEAGRCAELIQKAATATTYSPEIAVPAAPPAASGYGSPPVVFPEVAARAQGANTSNTLATVSMICGILSMVLCLIPIASLPIALAAIVCGHLARSKKCPSKGMTTAGLVLGYIALVVSAIIMVAGLYMAQHPEILEKLQEEALKQQK